MPLTRARVIIMPIEPDRLYFEIGYLLNEMPDMQTTAWQLEEGQRWFGRASALIEQAGNATEAIAFNMAVDSLHSQLLFPGAVQKINSILYRALARAEMAASSEARAAFIPVGEGFTAFAAISKIVREAQRTVMFVDPYAEANLMTEFAVLVPEAVLTLVLADAGAKKPTLAPAVRYWKEQYRAARPLEARLAPERSLHDRLIIVDDQVAWSIGQSFNALAARAPTSILRIDPETALLKLEAHLKIWEASTVID